MEQHDRSLPAGARIRLLWLIDSLTVGGAESLVVPFARALPRDRYDLLIGSLATIGGNPIERELKDIGARVVNLGARNLRDLAAFRRLMRMVDEEGIDIVHSHLTYASIWSSLLSRLAGVPSVSTLHVAPPAGGGRATLRDRLMQFSLNRWASRVITVSDALGADYAERRPIRRDKLVTLHNGIELETFARDRAMCRQAIERDFAVPAEVPLAITVSVLRPGKGVDVLLHAAQAMPEVHFLVVGDGPKREEWMRLARHLNVHSRIHWAGHSSDVGRYLAGADLLVHPSLADAFPTVLLEAMAAGLPVVASDVGGIPEIVQPGVTGLLVPPGNADRLAQAVGEIVNDRSVSGRMGEAGRSRARRKFSTTAWIERLDILYRDVLSHAAPSAGR